MLDRDFCRTQVRRMRGLHFFPGDVVEAVAELVNTLQKASSEAIAAEAVTVWMDQSSNAPTPFDIKVILCDIDSSSPIPDVRRPGEYKCDVCSDTGYTIVERGGQSGAVRCGACYTPRKPKVLASPEPDATCPVCGGTGTEFEKGKMSSGQRCRACKSKSEAGKRGAA